jgi:hypothetical protein
MEEGKLPELKDLYDELWRDARTLVKDMNKNIRTVFLYGMMCFIVAIVEFSLAMNRYEKVFTSSARWLDWFYLGASIIGVIVFVVAGISILSWYSTMKKRYQKLIEIEKKLGD